VPEAQIRSSREAERAAGSAWGRAQCTQPGDVFPGEERQGAHLDQRLVGGVGGPACPDHAYPAPGEDPDGMWVTPPGMSSGDQTGTPDRRPPEPDHSLIVRSGRLRRPIRGAETQLRAVAVPPGSGSRLGKLCWVSHGVLWGASRRFSGWRRDVGSLCQLRATGAVSAMRDRGLPSRAGELAGFDHT